MQSTDRKKEFFTALDEGYEEAYQLLLSQRQSTARKFINFNISTITKFTILWFILAIILPLNGFFTYFLLASGLTLLCCKLGQILNRREEDFITAVCIVTIVSSALSVLVGTAIIISDLGFKNNSISSRLYVCPNCHHTESIEFKNSSGKFTCINCNQRHVWKHYAFRHSYSSVPILMTNWTKTTRVYDEETGQLVSEYVSEINHDPRTVIYNYFKEKQ